MLQSEMLIQKVVKACASFRGADGRHLLHLCCDNITEYDPDVVFDKNAIFSAFCSKCCFFYETYLHSNVDKKRKLEVRIKQILKVEGLFFILMYCMIRYSYNKIFWGPLNFSKNPQKCWRWLATFFSKTLAGKELMASWIVSEDFL